MEIEHLLKLDSGDLITYEGSDEVLEKIRYWINTPVGSVWGLPDFGNSLKQFQHESPCTALNFAIEAHIITKLKVDMPLIEIMGIRVEAESSDLTHLTIITAGALTQLTFNRTA